MVLQAAAYRITCPRLWAIERKMLESNPVNDQKTSGGNHRTIPLLKVVLLNTLPHTPPIEQFPFLTYIPVFEKMPPPCELL